MNRPKSIFRRAAEGGITLGAIFVCIFLLETTAGALSWLLALGLMVYVPVFVYRKLRNTYLAAHGLMSFSGLWLEGILLFVCGSILLALGTLIFMKWLVPGYLPAAVAQMTQFIGNNPQMVDGSVSTEQIASYFSSIRPIDISMTLMWASSFTGSIASLVIAALVKTRCVPPPPSSNS